MSEILTLTNFVLTNIWSVLPFFLISIALSVLINKLEFAGYIRRAFNYNIGLSILLATLVGAFSPFCSCTVIPIVSGLLLSGVPLAPVMAFWIASPTMDPEIFALTVGVLGWPLAVTRLLATLALSLGAGYVTLLFTQTDWLRQAKALLQRQADNTAVCCAAATSAPQMAFADASAIPLTVTAGSSTTAPPAAVRSCGCDAAAAETVSASTWQKLIALDWSDAAREMGQESWRIGRWLIVAFLLEALIINYIPQEAIAAVLGHNNPLAVTLATLVGVPLYLSNYSALPIVAGLLSQGMQPGAAIAFLIAGPVTTVPAMTAVWGVVSRRIFFLYLAIGLLGSILLGTLVNLIFS
ncbi:MAG: permease [Anaerolineales bacterium]|nr:permease [Anaerolineales bacterium]